MSEDIKNSVRVLIHMVTVKIEKQGDGDALLNAALTEAKALLDGGAFGSDYRNREEAPYSVKQQLCAYLSL